MAEKIVETTKFADGNLILALPNRHFLVNKDLLVDKSGLVKDIFELGKQPDLNADVPTIPVDDDEEAFTVLIHALHDENLDRFFPKLRRSTINIISLVLDLCDKYIVEPEPIQRKLVPYIQRDWPESLSDWDANEEEVQRIQLGLEEKLKDSYLTDELDKLLPEPAAVIRFAYIYAPSEKPLQAVPTYLPAAFYHLSRIPPFADPGDTGFREAEYEDFPGLRTANKSLLRTQDFVSLLQGMNELRNEVSRLAFEGYPAEVKKGSQPENETKIMLDWWKKFGYLKLLGPDDRPDPLQRLKEIIDSLEENTSDDPDHVALYQGTSLAFRRRMRAFLTSERESLWGSLTDFFSLDAFFY